MKIYIFLCTIFLINIITACTIPTNDKVSANSKNIIGTWQLISGTTITKGKVETTDYTKGQQMIKIINNTHFAFLRHSTTADTSKGTEFDAGGGRYEFEDSSYTEHLDYYNNRNWEGKSFMFTVKFAGDTLVQQGIEKVEGAGIDRKIIEKYIRVK